MVDIIRAGLEHEERTIGLWERAGLTRPWVDASRDFVRGVTCEQSDILIAVEGEQVLASVLVGDDGHRGWLYSVAVDERMRHRGLGAALVRAAEGWLAARGQSEVRLLVRTENLAVVGFYEAIGYAEIGCIALGRTLHLGEGHV